MLTPAPVETYQFAGVSGSIATTPPSPSASCGHAVFADAVEVAAVPVAPSPTSSVFGSLGCSAKLTTSASDPSPPFRFSKCVASLAAHALPCSFTPSSDRHSPPSLPTYTSGSPVCPAPASVATACCAGATIAGELQP